MWNIGPVSYTHLDVYKRQKENIMDTTQTLIENYLAYCSSQKRLDEKTLKAYRIDPVSYTHLSLVSMYGVSCTSLICCCARDKGPGLTSAAST